MSSPPRVSICIPTYNYAQYLPQTIESALAQTCTDFDLIIVDDGSQDNTADVVDGYVRRDPRIRFYRNERNLGMAENWNACLEKTTGEYIKMMGADDILEPSCIEKSLKILEGNAAVTLVASSRLLIDEHSRPIRITGYANRFRVIDGAAVIKKCFFSGNLIGEPVAAMFRKKDATGGFDPRYRQLTDLEMWFRLLEKGKFAFIPEPLCRFRVHQHQASKANMRSLAFIDDELLLKQDYFDKAPIAGSFLAEQRWKFKLCYTIWMHKFIGLDLSTIRTRIREYMPLFLFYPLAYARAVRDIVVESTRGPRLRS